MTARPEWIVLVGDLANPMVERYSTEAEARAAYTKAIECGWRAKMVFGGADDDSRRLWS
jgi:hypothetical protein